MNPYYINNLVHENLLSGESFVPRTLFAQLLIHSIAIVSIYVPYQEKFQETSLFWRSCSLTISVSASIKHCIQHMLNRNEMQHTFHRFASWTTINSRNARVPSFCFCFCFVLCRLVTALIDQKEREWRCSVTPSESLLKLSTVSARITSVSRWFHSITGFTKKDCLSCSVLQFFITKFLSLVTLCISTIF